ncbi:MAG: helix-turn-helix domain-containing protein [Actinomycetota bacterium]|nr:helix-turn-helix domain-containing protein [Actinomycetota bacterium]
MHRKEQIAAAFAEEVGAVVRNQREHVGLRQDELALAAGVSARVVHQIEHGKPTSRIDSVLAVLDGLGLTLEVSRRA